MQRTKIISLLARLSLFCLLCLLFIGGSQPVAVKLFPVPWDKLIHALTFGLLFVVSSLAFPRIKPLFIWFTIIIIGMLDEIHQLYIPGRSAGLDDLLADIIGSFCALMLMHYLLPKPSKHS